MPAMQLIYCADVASFVTCSGTIGRFLLWRGRLSVALDANGRINELVGFYRGARARKYFKGPQRRGLQTCRTPSSRSTDREAVARLANPSRSKLHRVREIPIQLPRARIERPRLELPVVNPDHRRDLGEIAG
jgi:hypothetical protein